MQQFKWTLREVLVEYTAAGCGTRPWDGVAYFTENTTPVPDNRNLQWRRVATPNSEGELITNKS
jgi:hypothetical protein